MPFEDATTDIRPRLLMSLDGHPGSGRTRFALSAPRPIYTIQLDKGGLEGVLQDAADVKVAAYDFRKDLRQDDAKRAAQDVEDDIDHARDVARTVIIDKASYLWQLFRLAEFGKLSKVQARYYEGPNVRISELFRSFVDSDTNLILIHDWKDAYENDAKVGVKRDGFNGVEGIVRHAASFSGGARADDPFKVLVTRCTTNWSLVGTEFEGDTVPTFAEYASLAVPQVDPAMWQ